MSARSMRGSKAAREAVVHRQSCQGGGPGQQVEQAEEAVNDRRPFWMDVWSVEQNLDKHQVSSIYRPGSKYDVGCP